MKKIYILITSIVAGIICLLVLQKSELPVSENTQKELTPKEIWDLEFQKKKERHKEGYNKADKPDMIGKYFKDITTQIGAEKSGYKMNYQVEEMNKALRILAMKKGQKAALPWIERGPANVGGRTRALIIDPDDANHNTWFAGAASGGIWKTTDGGSTWVNLADEYTNLMVNSLAMANSNSNVIYAGTGESFGVYRRGNGVWKSTDKGAAWNQLSSTSTDENFAYINRIIINPADPDIVLVATETGIFKSINGGTDWSEVYTSSTSIEDLVADPTDFNILFAGENSVGVLRSTNAGDSWSVSSDGIGNAARVEVAVSPVDHNNVFASVNVSDDVSNVYISEDNGLTWKKFNDSQAFLSGQGWYDNIIEAHPYNADEAFIGGVDVWKVKFNGTTEESDPTVKKAYTENTTFLTFINFSGAFLGGGMDTTDGTNRVPSDWVSVEIRFGSGLTQKAHRFTVPDGATSGVSASDYSYQDYVDVPLQVWDVTNNRQLMVSFRDQEKDGAFNLYERTGDDYGELGREYIFVNSIEYNATTPNANITVNGGHLYKNLYMFWPNLALGEIWTPSSLPTSKIVVEYGTIQLYNGEKTSIADTYGNWGGPNGYDQGAGLGNTSIPGLHADHHNFAIIPLGGGDFTFIDASDGGLGISTDNAVTFNMLPNNYITTQFYGVAKHPTANEYMGGMQDNGTWQSPVDEDASNTTHYYFRIGGDGFECLWHAKDPNLMLGSVYNNAIRKSLNKGQSWLNSTTGMTSNDGPFITRLSASKENPDLVFAVGNNGLYRSTNFGTQWTNISISNNWALNGTVASSHNVEVSLANGKIVWAGAGFADGLNFHVSTNEGILFNEVTKYSEVEIGAYTSGIATHPIEDSTAYVLFSLQGKPKVLRTEDLGQTWEDISGFGTNSVSSNGFPDVQAHCLLVMPHDPNTIWVGTDIGLFESIDNGATWNYANSGLPPVPVFDMQIVGHQVVVATYGRGIWSVDIPEIDNYPYISDFTHVQSYDLNINTDLKVTYDSVQIYINGGLNKTVQSPTTGENDITVTVSEQGTQVAYMIAYIGDVPYKSNTIDLTLDLTSNEELEPSNLKTTAVYPNPSNGKLKIGFAQKPVNDVIFQVFTLRGLLVKAEKVKGTEEISLNLGQLNSGTYLLNIREGGKSETHKIVIK